MRLPRLTIATVMGLVVLVALDCAAVLAAFRTPGDAPQALLMGAMPMGNLLVIIAGWEIHRACRGEVSPFLTGFLIAGTIELAAFTVFVLGFWPTATILMLGTIFPVYYNSLHLLGLREGSPPAIAIGIPYYVTCFTAPQITIAWIAGRLNRRYRRGSWPGAVPPRIQLPRPPDP